MGKTHLQTRLTAESKIKKDFYNYDSSLAFNFSAYPVGRFANEFGYHSMPSLQTWQQAVPPSELYFNSSTIQLRNHHYPPGGLNISNFENSTKGMGEMTIAAQRWYPVRIKPPSSPPPFFSFIYYSENPQNFIYRCRNSQAYLCTLHELKKKRKIFTKTGPK